nr:Hypothetical protein [Aeromonas caviae]
MRFSFFAAGYSSVLKVATAGRWVGDPVGPRPAPGSGGA